MEQIIDSWIKESGQYGWRIYGMPSAFFKRNKDVIEEHFGLTVYILGDNYVCVKDKAYFAKQK